jgi:hypothetical protein
VAWFLNIWLLLPAALQWGTNLCFFFVRKAVVYLLWRLRWHLAQRQMENNRKGISARDIALLFSILAALAFSQSIQVRQMGFLGIYGFVLVLYTLLQLTGLLSLSRRLPMPPLGTLPVAPKTLWQAEFWGVLLDVPLLLCLPFILTLSHLDEGGGASAIALLLLLLTLTALFVSLPRRSPKILINLPIKNREHQWVMEALLLLRHPQNHFPLRGPAALIILFFFAWMAPNIDFASKKFALLNLQHMLSLIMAFYIVLWQVQLLTNRFGAEYRTGGLLFLQPFERKQLLLWRNVVLVVFLLILDTLITLIITLSFHYTQWILWILQAITICLIVFTSFGNLLSLWQAYTIRIPPGSLMREPENSVAFAYGLIGCVAGGLITLTLQWPVLGWLATLALYPLSLRMAVWAFPKFEPFMVAKLEQK